MWSVCRARLTQVGRGIAHLPGERTLKELGLERTCLFSGLETNARQRRAMQVKGHKNKWVRVSHG